MQVTEEQIHMLLELESSGLQDEKLIFQILQISQEEDTNVIIVEYVAPAHRIYPVNDKELYVNLTFEINVDGVWGCKVKLMKIA